MSTLIILMLVAVHGNEDPSPCGADALTKCLNRLDQKHSPKDVASLLPRAGVDASLLELKQLAEKIGLYCRAIRWDKRFPEGVPPAIIRVRLPTGKSHFIAILETKGDRVLVAEGESLTWVADAMLRASKWDGIALHISRSATELFFLGRFWPLFGLLVIVVLLLTSFLVSWNTRFKNRDRNSQQIRKTNASEAKHGITLVEILVCLAIVGLLMAMLSPAIQSSRERARALTCMNNLRQLGLAMNNFADSNGRFPPTASPQLLKNVVLLAPPYSISAHYNLLPYLDLSSIQQSIVFENDVWTDSDPPNSTKNNDKIKGRRIPVFLCPSDSGQAGATNYMMCHGTSTDGHTTEGPMPNSSRAGFSYAGIGPRPADVSDGLSNTIAFSERLIGAGVRSKYVPSRDIAIGIVVDPPPRFPDEGVDMCAENVTLNSRHTSFSGVGWLFWGLGRTTYNQILPPNSSVPDCQMGTSNVAIGVFTARSLHPSGCHILLGDGGVRFVNQSIDEALWRGLGTINSADPAELQ